MDLFGWYFLLFMGFFLPWLAIRSGRQLAAGATFPSKTRYLISTLILQVFIGLLAFWTARRNGIVLFPPLELRARDLLAALGILALLCGSLQRRWRSMTPERRARLAQLLPQTGREFILFVILVLAAGVSEEIAYRGVLFALLSRVAGSAWVAALLAAVAFGVAHMVQGRKSALIIAVFALAVQGLAAFTGALYAGILVHIFYDVVAAVVYRRLLRRDRISAAT